MTITLELPSEVQARLRAKIARRDAESMRRILAEALAPTVEALLQQPHDQIASDEFETVADKLGDELAAFLKPDDPVLSDYGMSRAGIYEDHP